MDIDDSGGLRAGETVGPSTKFEQSRAMHEAVFPDLVRSD